MEKRVIGIILIAMGIVGLIVAGYYFNSAGQGTRNIKPVIMYGVLGIIFFASGIGLIKNTADKPT
ncbi:MAG: hypothetical protein ABIX01_23515 [Chitinophagaceae bacterium]